MQAAMEEDSDSDFNDEETDTMLQDCLKETDHIKLEPPKPSHDDLVYTPTQLEQIAMCKDAITRHRELVVKYKAAEESLVSMLVDVRQRLKVNEEALIKQSRSPIDVGFNYLRCGKPYFKDKNNFVAPDNEDTIMMREAKMYDFSQVGSVPGWTVKDKTELVNALLEFSRDIKKKELRTQVSKLRKDKNKNSTEINRLEKEISQLNKKTLMEIALPLDQDYDWEDLATTLNRRHTAQEYKALWKLFFHPSINKENWSRSEHQHLQKIAREHNLQNWDKIAKKLNTGRTGYQCFVYYRTNMVNITSNRKWTAEEVAYLQHAIEYYREGTYIPWGKVASAMDGRTKIQVYNKYTRMMERRKGRFLEEEDIVLMNCYDKYGDDFKRITEYLPGRSAVQLRTRFNLLTKFRLSTTWTVKEDRKLLQIMANLDSNSSYSNATAHFPGKDRINIRSRYVTLMKWLKAHPATDISMAPRRGARRLLHGCTPCDFEEAIAKLNKRIQTEVKTKNKAKISRSSTEEQIEDAIMAALVNEIIKEESQKKVEKTEPEEDTLPIESFLTQSIPAQNKSKQSIINFRELLVFLNANLEKVKFCNSKYASQYPELVEQIIKESTVKLKSYSKTKSVQTIAVDSYPDIWGTKASMKHSTYVLPPNYATITGCRVLMKHFGAKPDASNDGIDLSMMLRKNLFVKEAMNTLKERFISLFLWPLLLSNALPSVNPNEPYVSRPEVEKTFLPKPTGLTIPTPKATHLKFKKRKDADKEGIDEPQLEKLSEIQVNQPRVPSRTGMLTSDEDSNYSDKNFASEHD